MPAPQKILTLVEHFKRKREELTSTHYKEAQLRVEFLDPLLEALGWDVRNTQGHSEAMKEVIHEDAIRIGDAMKAPDYCMKIGRDRKFFVEAKKPSVDIKGEPTPALQLRRYAWSAKLPLSILSDFEEFAIYDCRIRPHKADKASTARIFFCTFEDYAKRWDEIATIFSKEAVLKGSFDKYAGEKRRGTQEVDDEFLKEIEHWRELLAKNIATRNPSLGQQEMNYAVQQTIDRIIFLRICEDRGIETYRRLQSETNGQGIYGRLKELFREADARYNSGLFHFKEEKSQGEPPDTVTSHIDIDDSVLKEIISCLYPPESPYAFSVISSEILGQVYEQFLGKVIRLTEGHHAKVEEKPEVRKAGGVYYTPKYIVDYIVEHTVGKLLEGKTPKQVAELKIVDPACGSGSFLLGAYQLLLDWHLTYYTEHEPKKWKKELYMLKLPSSEDGSQWRLTTAERKRILLNNIFGVDIDPQAVEVTKLSLLLKVLEGETAQSMQTQMFHERVLPDLGKNIQCGNSLIGPDFYDGEQQTLLHTEDADRQRINVFDWQAAFPEVFKRKNPGFDAVIGNPPYIRIQAMKEWAPIEVEYYKKRYVSASRGNYDIYVVFAEKGLSLLNQTGLLGFILPHKFFNAQYGEPLREIISKGKHLEHVVHFGDLQVFSGATTYTCLLFLSKISVTRFPITKVSDLEKWRRGEKLEEGEISSSWVGRSSWSFTIGKKAELFEAMRNSNSRLGEIAHIFVGTQTSADDVFVLDECMIKEPYVYGRSNSLDKEVKVELDSTVPFLRGKDIRRYLYPQSTSRLILPYEISKNECHLRELSDLRQKFPAAIDVLKENVAILKAREHGKFEGANWYAFGYPKSMNLFSKLKIISPDYNNEASFTYDDQGHFFKTGYGIIVKEGLDPFYVLGLLNSKLLFQYLLSIGTTLRGGYVRFWNQYIEQLPIVTTFDSRNEFLRDAIVHEVNSIFDLRKKFTEAKTPHDQALNRRQIEAADSRIDGFVYELYGLTKKEITIVEESCKTHD